MYIERDKDENFILEIMKPNFKKQQSIENITLELNQLLEKMILRKPQQWICLITGGNKLITLSFNSSLNVRKVWFLQFNIPII